MKLDIMWQCTVCIINVVGLPFRSMIEVFSQSRPGTQLAVWHLSSKHSLVQVTQHHDSLQCQQCRKNWKVMADLSVAPWPALKWLITCSLIAIVVFQRTIQASLHKLFGSTHRTTNSKPAMDPRTSNIHDIYHTVFLLQQKLVRDVIPAIIEYAELYNCTVSETRFYPIQRISEHQAPKQLLICEIPKPVARVLQPVRKIVFSINSHDQGFASDRNGM